MIDQELVTNLILIKRKVERSLEKNLTLTILENFFILQTLLHIVIIVIERVILLLVFIKMKERINLQEIINGCQRDLTRFLKHKLTPKDSGKDGYLRLDLLCLAGLPKSIKIQQVVH